VATLPSLSQKILDGLKNIILAVYFGRDQSLLFRKVFLKVLDKLSTPVMTLDLPVRELVGLRKEFLFKELHAAGRIPSAPIVSV
jgi:hypothetical protein